MLQSVDRVDFQNGIIHHDAEHHHQANGRHHIQRRTSQQQNQKRSGNPQGQGQHHNHRLNETLKLGSKNKIQQQDRNDQNPDQLTKGLLIPEKLPF